jgi:uncharacterized repeat protein (TIGR01451 family)/gliding motility-associated-like protein
VIASNKTTVCGTEKATLTATGCTGGTITWSGGLGAGTTKEVGAGTYTATCTTSCGTSGNSNTITIGASPAPVAPVISANKTEICGNEEITLTATGCNGTVKWSTNATGNSIKVSQAGDYAAVCTNACGESGNSNIIKINLGGVPNAPLITTDKVSVCDTAKARLVAVGCNSTIEWSNGATGEVIFVGVGTYTAKCKNSCGISLASNIIKIENGVVPTAPSISANKLTVCGTEKAVLTATGCSGGTVTWSGGLGTGTTKEVGAGTYTATCTTSCGTSLASSSVTITANPASVAPTITANKTSICGTDKATLTATGCTGGTVTWSGTLGTGITKEVTAGTYTATCTTSCGVSGNSNTVTVTSGQAPSAPTVVANKTSICGTEKATLTASGCDGGTITWSGGLGVGTSKEVSAGTYTATCTTSCGTSGNSASLTITVGQTATAPTIASSKASVCGTEKATLTATGCSGGTITWSGSLGTGTTKEVGAGTYTATCTNTCGTSGASNSVTISQGTVPTAPVIVASKNEICGTEEITLTASGCSGTIKWSNNQTGTSIKVSQAGDYAATCSNTCGESNNSNIVKINLGAVPNAPLITTDRVNVCGTEKARLVAVGCTSTIEWSTGETGEMIQVGAGNYTAKCKNSCGISLASNIIKIETGGRPAGPTIVANNTSICGTDSAKLTATVCSGTVKWSNGKEGNSIFVKTAGSYTATCTNACGTSLPSDPIAITVGGAPSAPIITASSKSICAGDSAILSTDGCSGTLTWSTGATGSSIKVKVAGSYTVKCTNSCGASPNSQPVVIEIKTTGCGTGCNVPALVITASKTSVCDPEDITLTTTGCTTGTIIWSNGKNGNSIVVKPVVTTTYSAVCKIADCVSPVSNVVEVKVQKATKPVVACATDVVCPGESVTIRAYECDGIIKWSNGMTGSAVDVKPTETSKYTAICVVGTCESAVSDTLCIKVGAPVAPFVTCKTSTVCLGESAVYTAQGCTGTVIWSNGQTGSVLTYTATAAGTYSFSAKCKSIGGTCESASSKAVAITVGGAVPKPTALAEIKNICPFETVDLNNAVLGNPSNADATFEFHVSNSPNSTLITAPGMVGAGNYYLFERSKVGCFSDGVLVKVLITDCGDGGITPDSSKFVDISVKKTADSTSVPVNSFVDYTVVVRNLKNYKATNLIVRDVIPSGLVIESVSSNAKFVNGIVTAKIDSLKNTDSVKFTYRAKVTAAGKIENKAEVLSVDQIDPVLSNNTSVFTINDVSKTDLIGLSKNLGTITKIADNKYEVPFTFNIRNMGATKLTKVKLVDDLGVTFGSGVEIMDDTIAVTAAAGLKANPNYTGRGNNTSLLVDSLSNLEVGQTLSVSFKVKVDITNASKTEFFNTAKVFAGAAQAISDVSTSGTNPDPDGNGNPLDNDEPTKVTFTVDSSKVAIATALSIVDSTLIDEFTYEVKYMALVKNIGFSQLKNVYLVDTLSKTFPDSVQFTLEGQPTVSSSSLLVKNPAFDGDTDYRLTLPDTASKLAPGKVDTVFFTVRLKYNKNYGPYLNNIVAYGTSTTGTIVSDISNAGTEIIPLSSTPTIFRVPKDSTVANNLVDLIEIPGGFSPNGDETNETLESVVPEGVSVEMFEIYNRWGHLVWKYTGSETVLQGGVIKWDATSNTGMRFGPEGVPDGTYYYSVKVKDQAKVRNGFITVAR